MKGTLGEGVLPGLLRDLYVGRRTGFLIFARANENRSVYFRRGHILNARTDVKEDWLGEVLVRHGYLSSVDLERATTLVQMERIRLGQALYDLGLFDKETLEDALALHVREVLFKVFSWGEGTYMFEERDEMAPSTTRSPSSSPRARSSWRRCAACRTPTWCATRWGTSTACCPPPRIPCCASRRSP